MIVRLKKRSQAEWLILFILFMPFLFFFLMDLLQIPSVIKYTVDFAWIGTLVLLFFTKFKNPDIHIQHFIGIIVAFFALTLCGQFMNYQSILYYLWGIRINARFFVFFFACIFFLRKEMADQYLSFMDTIFWINFPIVLYQYFVMEKMQDNIGGVFGVEMGCNAYTNIFLIIVVSKSVLSFMYQKETAKACILKCVAALIVAVLSELKVFFIELILLLIFSFFSTGFSFRKLWILLGIGAGVAVAAKVIASLFSGFEDWFSIGGMLAIVADTAGYTSSNDMNRFTAVPIALEFFLPTWTEKLWGLGLGNTEHATFSFLVTPFYEENHPLHYMWFSSASLVLETGLIGLGLYILFFVMVFIAAHRRRKEEGADLLYCQLAKIMSIMSILMVVYNSAMRMEAAFMIYFVLALPFLIQTDANEDNFNEGQVLGVPLTAIRRENL